MTFGQFFLINNNESTIGLVSVDNWNFKSKINASAQNVILTKISNNNNNEKSNNEAASPNNNESNLNTNYLNLIYGLLLGNSFILKNNN